MEITETNTIINLKRGDHEAFTYVYQKYFKALMCFTNKYLKNTHDAEEIVQSLFLKLWERRLDINESMSFKSYLFQIASNDVNNFIKRKIIEKRYVDWAQYFLYASYEYENNNEMQDYLEKITQVNSLINMLPPKRKLIFKMKKIDGLTHNEIANDLNLSVRTIENHVLKAMSYLKNIKNMKFIHENSFERQYSIAN